MESQTSGKRTDVRNVVVLLAGSRTGSSFLFQALTSLGKFIAPTGEETPFYRQAGLGFVRSSRESDEMLEVPAAAVLDDVAVRLLRDCGLREDENFPRDAFAAAILERTGWQFPDSRAVAQGQAHWLEKNLKALEPGFSDWRNFYFRWLKRLSEAGSPVDLSLFEAGTRHPEHVSLLEEPPYVVSLPKLPATAARLGQMPLLLKTTTHVYRIPFLRALFPKANFRWIVLQRNPAATVSGLIEGWLSSGFHAHDLSGVERLRIGGYSDIIPGGDRFWKFDLPPGWCDQISRPLAEVASFQWHSAAVRLSEFAGSTSEPVLHLRYEDFVNGDPVSRLREVLAFAGAAPRHDPRWSAREGVVAVSAPAPGKWKKREAEITAALRNFSGGKALDLARSLHYDPAVMGTWL